MGEQPPDTNQHVHQRAIFYIQTLSAHIFNERNRSSTRSGGKFTRSNEQKSEKKDHPARKAGLMSLSEQLDILICILPKVSPDAPTAGPSQAKDHGCQSPSVSTDTLARIRPSLVTCTLRGLLAALRALASAFSLSSPHFSNSLWLNANMVASPCSAMRT